MVKKTENRHQLDGIAALLLFAVFAVCILMVLLTGADAYRRLTQRDTKANSERTAVQYISQRVRQADMTGGVYVEDFEGTPALVLVDSGASDGSAVYVTRVYCQDGWLTELYSDQDTDLGPEAGERIIEAQAMEPVIDNGLLSVKLTDTEGGVRWVFASPRSGEGSR